MTVNEHRLLARVIAQLPKDGGRQRQTLALQRLLSEIFEYRRHPERLELLLEPVAHRDRLATVRRISADTVKCQGADRDVRSFDEYLLI